MPPGNHGAFRYHHFVLRIHRPLAAIVIVLLAASCGGTTSATTAGTSSTATAPTTQTSEVPATTVGSATTTNAPAPTTSSTTAATSTTTQLAPSTAEPLRSYRFQLAVAVVPNPGDPPGAPVYRLSGERTSEPEAMRIFGDFKGESLELVTDGSRWWDLDDLDLEIGPADIQFFIGGNGFMLPEWLGELLADDSRWQAIDAEELNGVATQRARRVNIVGGVDWELGNLAQLDVWRDDLGQLVKLQAWFATGDNTGFPVSIWEITEANPQLEIQLPAG